jgi:hypothetical protein
MRIEDENLKVVSYDQYKSDSKLTQNLSNFMDTKWVKLHEEQYMLL